MPRQGQEKGTPKRRAEFIEKLRQMGEGQWCVTWPWSDIRGAYVYIHVNGVKVSAHRWVYEQVYGVTLSQDGPGATGPVVAHHCDNPPCVRPSHLFLTDQLGNMGDAAAKGRMPGGTTGGGRPKLSNVDRETIRYLAGRPGIRQADIARAYNVSDAAISHIVRGRRPR